MCRMYTDACTRMLTTAQVATKHGKTAAQVILRWGVQLGLSVLTRSSKEERLREAAKRADLESQALYEGEPAAEAAQLPPKQEL